MTKDISLDGIFNCFADNYHHFDETVRFIKKFQSWCQTQGYPSFDFKTLEELYDHRKKERTDNLSYIGIMYFSNHQKQAEEVTFTLFRASGYLKIESDGYQEAGDLLRAIACSTSDVFFTNDNGFFGENHFHIPDYIIAGQFSRISHGIQSLITPPSRTIEVLEQLFAGWLRNHNLANEEFQNAQTSCRARQAKPD